jgi:hypothetical protein
MIRRLMLQLSLLLVLAPLANAQGQWTTYLHAHTGNDLIALRDTVWIATAEAGLVRYFRSTDTWTSTTAEPSGMASNNVNRITFDRRGNLFASFPGRGVGRLDTDGRWSLINTFDGLPSDSALALRAQGDTVWIGTTRGLALWDGHTVAGSVPDLGTPSPFLDNNINGIVVTGDTLFISNPLGVQIARLSQHIATWTVINSGLPLTGALPNQDLNVRGLASEGHNVFALASGVNPTNPTQPVFTSFLWYPSLDEWHGDFPPTSPSVRRLRDDFGRLLATTTGGVYERTFPAGWTLVPGSPATDNGDIFLGGVEVGADPSGHVFAFAREALLEDTTGGFKARVPPGPIGNGCFNLMSVNGSVYVGYDGEGVGRLRDGVWTNYPAGFTCQLPECDPDTTFANSSFPTAMLADPSGSKWIGMWSGPLSHFDDEVAPPRFHNIHYPSASPDTVELHTYYWSATADDNTGANAGRWFGLDTNDRGNQNKNPDGIDLYDTSGTLVRNFPPNYPNLRNGQVRALAEDTRRGKMWVGYASNASAGLSTFPLPATIGHDITLTDVPNTRSLDCFGIAVHGDSIWVLATDGLHRFRDTTEVTKLPLAGPPAPRGAVHPLAVGPDGSVYVGTTGGLRVHRRGQLPVDYTPDNSPLADIEIRAVFVDPKGVVWIGTARGMNRFDPDYVPPPPPKLASLSVTLYPNPAWRTGVGFELHLKGQATAYDGEVYDLSGRLVHRFHVDGNDRVFWDGRDLEQNWIGAGVYFVHVRGGGAETTSRVVVLR